MSCAKQITRPRLKTASHFRQKQTCLFRKTIKATRAESTYSHQADKQGKHMYRQ